MPIRMHTRHGPQLHHTMPLPLSLRLHLRARHGGSSVRRGRRAVSRARDQLRGVSGTAIERHCNGLLCSVTKCGGGWKKGIGDRVAEASLPQVRSTEEELGRCMTGRRRDGVSGRGVALRREAQSGHGARDDKGLWRYRGGG